MRPVLLVLLLASLLASCSDDAPYSVTTDGPCQRDDQCAEGERCDDGECVLVGDDEPDAGSPDADDPNNDVNNAPNNDPNNDVNNDEPEIGAPCDGPDDCPSGFCIEVAGDGRRGCTDYCNPGAGDCPTGYVCAAVANSGADRTFLCFPEVDILCDECESDADCGGLSDLCLSYPDGSFCGRSCQFRACPEGFDCVEVEGPDGPTSQCRSQAGVCSACFDPDNDGFGVGPECRGRDCRQDDPRVFEGAQELCNGEDDDCDGDTDEDFDLLSDPARCGGCDVACGFEGAEALCVEGECALGPCRPDRHNLDGREDNGCEYFCEISNDGEEICDGLDNDCDGQTDEGNPGGGGTCDTGQPGVCQPGVAVCRDGALICDRQQAPTAEICDGLDNDCDGRPDEGNPGGGGACNTGLFGVCEAGTLQCQDGALACDPLRAPSDEVCDGLDNNCNGPVDEGNPGGGGACNTGIPGVCAQGVLQCQNGALACNQTRQPAPETCDGLDNNCDGRTDEGNPGGGGACNSGLPGICQAGTLQCQNGALACPANLAPQREICDGLDNDCDASSDEGCPLSLSTGNSRDLTANGGGGGSPFRIQCGAGQVAVGVDLRAGSELDQLQVVCQAITLATNQGAVPFTYGTNATGAQVRTAAAGGGGGSASTMICPAGSFLHSARVRSGSRIDQLSLTCARFDYVGFPLAGRTTRTDTQTRTFAGTGGTLRAETRCNDGEFIAGFYGRAGSRIDQLGAICRIVPLAVR